VSKLLIVEDEKELADVLKDYFIMEGFDVEIAYDGEQGLTIFKQYSPELVILDIMLPKMNGIEVCKQIRKESDAFIFMLSAKDGEMDKVISLGAGADDYITKPFSPLELMARVKAHQRRYRKTEVMQKDGELRIGEVTLYLAAYEARIRGQKMELTTKEFEVLRFMGEHLNQVFSKEQIYHNVWGSNEYGDVGTVAVYIKRLREKLESYQLSYIKTIWGAGYKMTMEDS